MIPESAFLKKMDEQWREFGNTPNQALTKAWRQQCEVFNEMIQLSKPLTKFQEYFLEEGGERETVWKILQPPTGSGKTLGTQVYAAMLAMPGLNYHPGCLIVTRLMDDADSIAERINELSRKYNSGLRPDDKVAAAYHSDHKKELDLKDLAQYPVLVITHRAYALALDQLKSDSMIEDTWDYLYRWKNGVRRLVVIDEAIDIIEASSVNLKGIRMLLHFIPQAVRNELPNEITFLKTMEAALELLESQEGESPQKERVITSQPLADHSLPHYALRDAMGKGIVANEEGDTPIFLNFGSLKEQLGKVQHDKQLYKTDPEENRRLHAITGEILSSVDALYKSWVYYSKDESMHTFNTARLLVPKDAPGAVILDATAEVNTMYELFDNAQVISPPEGTRSYGNVTLHVSSGHRVGKNYMEDHLQEVTDEFMREFTTLFGNDKSKRKVLIVSHKGMEHQLLQYQPDEFELHVAHYGAINGSNEWKDCDTVAIFGLPFRPQTFPVNAFMSFKGVQTTEWLNSTGDRPYKDHEDIREAITTGQMTADVVQAINRVRCRKVIDDKGNCPTTDIYILLPSGLLGEKLIVGIKKQMPGIKIREWVYTGQKQKKRGVKKGNYDRSLLAYFENYLTKGDRMSSTRLREAIGLSPRTFERLVGRIKKADLNDPLIQGLSDRCVSYNVRRTGKVQKGYFMKH